MLEQKINNAAGEKEYKDKLKDYNKSQYKWIHTFCDDNPNWNESQIEDRASMMAETFYTRVLGRE
ncbi:MAG: DUF1524 domain-containing protein [Lachnospiraceae bacterium]|nr:DUF1524 domain-containing protein [Lachnospiraceae bacterium]